MSRSRQNSKDISENSIKGLTLPFSLYQCHLLQPAAAEVPASNGLPGPTVGASGVGAISSDKKYYIYDAGVLCEFASFESFHREDCENI